MKEKIKKTLTPNQFMLDNYFYPAADWICGHKILFEMLSIPMLPIEILYGIWYIVSLIDDFGDFIWFRYVDMNIKLMTDIVESKKATV